MYKIKSYYLTLGLILLAVSSSFFVALTINEFSFPKVIYSPIQGKVVFGESSNLKYDVKEKIVKDLNNLEYDLSGEKVLVNKDREFEFIVLADGEEYNFKKEVKRKQLTYSKDIFTGIQNLNGLEIEQEIVFSDDQSVKFNHYIKNKKGKDLHNLTYYYVFELFENDELIVNGSKCDYRGNCKNLSRTGTTEVGFNKDYYFLFEDLIIHNFTLKEIKFKENKLWLGFSNNEILKSNQEIDLDPTFSTNDLRNIHVATLSDEMFIVSWIVDDSDSYFAIYWVNGTKFSGDHHISELRYDYQSNKGIFASAFNSTHIVISHYNHRNGNYFWNISDIYGNFGADGELSRSWDDGGANSVCTFNDTHFAMVCIDDTGDDIEYHLYDFQGNSLGGGDADSNAGSGAILSTSITCLDYSTFAISWYDEGGEDIYYRVYNFDKQLISGSTIVDYNVGSFGPNQVEAYNATHLAFSYMDNARPSTRVMDKGGNSVFSATRIISRSVGTSRFNDVAPLNETHHVIAWRSNWPNQFNAFSIYDFWGTEVIEEQNITTTAQYDISVTSEDARRNVGICNDNFIVAWSNSSSVAEWRGYFPNGTQWYGKCVPEIRVFSPEYGKYRPGNLFINISAKSYDSSISSCSYSLDDGSTNYSMNQDGYYWDAVHSFNAEGDMTITFFCVDGDSVNIRKEKDFTIEIFPVDVEPYGADPSSVSMAPLDTDTFVIVYGSSDNGVGAGYNYKSYYKIYYTNGTQFGERHFIGNFKDPRHDVGAFNDTHFVVFHGASNLNSNYLSGNLLFSIFDTSGNVIVNWTNVTLSSDWTWGDISILNETHVGFSHSSSSYGGRAYYSVWDSEGNEIVQDALIDTRTGTVSSYQKAVSSAFNYSHIAYCFYDNFYCSNNCVRCEVNDIFGNQVGSQVTLDTSVYNKSRSLNIQTLNETHYVVSLFDSDDNANVFWVYDFWGNEVVGRTETRDTGAYDHWNRQSEVAPFNETDFVSAWSVSNVSFRPYSSQGTAHLSNFQNASIDPILSGQDAGVAAVAATEFASGLGLCSNTFVIAWNETYSGNHLFWYSRDGTLFSNTYSKSGLVWNGFYSNGSRWDGFCEGPCEYYGGGDWVIECDSNCTITNNYQGDGSDIYILGDGHTIISSNITGFDDIRVDGQGGHCTVTFNRGGGIK